MKTKILSFILMMGMLFVVGAAAQNKSEKAADTSSKKALKQAVQPEDTNAENSTTTDPTAQEAAALESTEEGADDTRRTAVRSRMTLKVVNPDDARAALKKTAVSLGGYATHITDATIVLKLPPQQLTAAIDAFVTQGILVEKTIEREDLTMEIAQLEGKLNSQNEILTKLRSFFDDSDFAATLDIERSMSRLVFEIEEVKGRLRYLYDQAEWAVVEVDFRFRERESVMYVASPFEWLNSANLSTFLEEF